MHCWPMLIQHIQFSSITNRLLDAILYGLCDLFPWINRSKWPGMLCCALLCHFYCQQRISTIKPAHKCGQSKYSFTIYYVPFPTVHIEMFYLWWWCCHKRWLLMPTFFEWECDCDCKERFNSKIKHLWLWTFILIDMVVVVMTQQQHISLTRLQTCEPSLLTTSLALF